MAKKKKKQETKFSPKSYLKSGKARNLPLYECRINDNWQEIRKANVIVSRQHKSGFLTVGLYLIDLMCTGVKDTGYKVNIPKDNYFEVLESHNKNDEGEFVTIDYNTLHNIIYGAVEFAEDYGIPPHPDFAFSRMILAEDNDDIPLVDIDFGDNGIPHLIPPPGDSKTKFYLDQLKKYAGEGNFHYTLGVEGFDDDDDEIEEDFDIEDTLEEEDVEDPAFWGYEDWEYFIDNTMPFRLAANMEAVQYIFEKCFYEPAIAEKKQNAGNNLQTSEINITYEPIRQQSYSEEEVNEQAAINNQLQENGDSSEQLNEIINRIYTDIEKWPHNPVFHNCLYNAYRLIGYHEKAEKIAYDIYQNFPDYVTGLILYTFLLVTEDQMEQAEMVLNNRYNLQSLFPHREEFHITEIISFHFLMCCYFLKKQQVSHAFSYWKFLENFGVGPFENWHHSVYDNLERDLLQEVGGLLFDIRNRPDKKQEIIEWLIQKA